MNTKRDIRLIQTDDGECAAVDEESGVTGTGEIREEALSNLDASDLERADE
ncbi:hypothetical protein Hbl1158_04480 [Halobaculum sp. CBA1158]|uniref:type II toxin-antitoxin system HicB family antitoxin n=1 Tax=Halobaculum sp. CBA1158 TaxID=2904243 RepID=UPI001F34E355|nr:hypothetical protein [Halobaculum sp. CBA1158]UIP00623.1 hypothetical protein Hbl1158_04480 [Halobaculum sp. CBA1158]